MLHTFNAYEVLKGTMQHKGVKTYLGWKNSTKADDNNILTSNAPTVFNDKTAFRFYQFCEDGFPYLTYLALGNCVTGEKYLTMEEAQALEAQYGPEKAAIRWFKSKGYTTIICDYYCPQEHDIVHYVWVLS